MKKEVIIPMITVTLGLLFSYTALSKISDYSDFASQIGHSEAGRFVSPRLAWLIPLSEAVIVCLLAVKPWRLLGLYASCLFLIAATIYITGSLRSEVKLECACGGFLDKMPKPAHIAFNLIFILAAAAAIKIFHDRPGKEKWKRLSVPFGSDQAGR